MNITSYKDNPQAFLNDLKLVNMDQLTGNNSSELEPMLRFIKEKGIRITELETGNPPVLNEELLKKVLAYFMPEDALLKGRWYDGQIKSGVESLKQMLAKAVEGDPTAKPHPIPPKTQWSLKEFITVAHFGLTGDRIDDDVIGVMVDAMKNHSDKRDKLKNEVGALTAELRIYAVIQAEINNKLSNGNALNISASGLVLLDYRNFGYKSFDDFSKSEEFKLLNSMRSDPQSTERYLREAESKKQEAQKIQSQIDSMREQVKKDRKGMLGGFDISEYTVDPYYKAKYGVSVSVARNQISTLLKEASNLGEPTVKQFLESPKKFSGAMTGLVDEYKYDKENNKLGNFATLVSDKSRPINDKVSQKTTELNDISSRYNSTIEALNRFIQKYDSVMQQILQAI